MSKEAKNIVIVSASPRTKEKSTSTGEISTSAFLAATGGEIMKSGGAAVFHINVRQSIIQKRSGEDFAALLQADAVIFIFPLYIFCLPGILMRFLQDYYDYYMLHKENAAAAKVYAVINCGFPEPGINTEAARVIASFSKQTGNHFRFAMLIGGGGMLYVAKDAPFMKKTLALIQDGFARMLEDTLNCSSESLENIQIKVNFPRILYFFMGNRGWSSLAKKHGLKKKDLYRRPYREG